MPFGVPWGRMVSGQLDQILCKPADKELYGTQEIWRFTCHYDLWILCYKLSPKLLCIVQKHEMYYQLLHYGSSPVQVQLWRGTNMLRPLSCGVYQGHYK